MATDNEEETLSAPLMRDRRTSRPESDVTSSNAFIWTLTFAAAISGLLFGYEYVEHVVINLNADSFKVPASFPRLSFPSALISLVR